MAYKAFIDTNIFLDHFLQRNEFSSQILKKCENGDFQGCASSASFYTISYILEKHLSRKEAKYLLSEYIQFVKILPTFNESLSLAISSNFSDLENAFQYFTAIKEARVDYFITNNLKNFKQGISTLPVISSKEFSDLFHI